MAHVDPADLVEIALGHQVSGDDVRAFRHIAVCTRCRDELHCLARVVTAARSVEAADMPATPSERVWQQITRELSRADASPAEPSHRPVIAAPDETLSVHTRNAATFTVRVALALLAGVGAVRRVRRTRSRRRTAQDR